MASHGRQLAKGALTLATLATCLLFLAMLVINLRGLFGGDEPRSIQIKHEEEVNMESRSWKKTRNQKLADDRRKIRAEWILESTTIEDAKGRMSIAGKYIESLLDAETARLTSLDVPSMMNLTMSGRLSAEDLVTAFCKRAAFAHQLNDALLEINFENAIMRAQALDRYRRETGKPLGALHGLPMTMKDQFHVKGMNTTMGYVGWIDTFEGNKTSPIKGRTESEVVRQLESLGAVVIGKTTCVQSLWFGETNNNILGYNFNPVRQSLSSGGSSGGEGAIQALKGSAIGLGTDIGGSVSMPAAYNGIYSLKPSANRLSFKNVANSSPGQSIIPTVIGLIGTSLPSIRYLFKAMLSAEPWLHDPEALPIPWRDEVASLAQNAKLSFGILEHDGMSGPHPPISRALRIVADALRSAGHTIVDWKPPFHEEARELHNSIVNADGNYDIPQQLALSGEPIIKELRPYFPDGKAASEPLTAIEVEHLTLRMRDFRWAYHDYWESTRNLSETGRPVDAVLMPVTPTAAVIPGKSYHYTYISIVNTLDYTTIVIPVTTADKKIDLADPTYVPVDDEDRLNWEAYDPEKYHGAPAGIQILGRRLEEEKLLAVAQVVVEALKSYKTNKGVGRPESQRWEGGSDDNEGVKVLRFDGGI